MVEAEKQGVKLIVFPELALTAYTYPIRVTKLTGGGLALNVHHWDICKPAFEKGKREGIRVYQFLKNPLTKSFGEDFYEALCAAATHLNG